MGKWKDIKSAIRNLAGEMTKANGYTYDFSIFKRDDTSRDFDAAFYILPPENDGLLESLDIRNELQQGQGTQQYENERYFRIVLKVKRAIPKNVDFEEVLSETEDFLEDAKDNFLDKFSYPEMDLCVLTPGLDIIEFNIGEFDIKYKNSSPETSVFHYESNSSCRYKQNRRI